MQDNSGNQWPHRDVVGYADNPPTFSWPDKARVAVSLVINYEEGSERSLLYGDDRHETRAEMDSFKPPDVRDLQTESQWEYGSRVGVWRLMRILRKYGMKATFFLCAMALEQNPRLAAAISHEGHDVAGHGYRWIEQWNLGLESERDQIRRAAEAIERMIGRRPLGWFTKAGPSQNTRALLAEEGFLYDSEGLNDDLPYYTEVAGRPWLVVPYTFDVNDSKYWGGGWANSEDFVRYLKDTFDVLYDEGRTEPKMMSVGLHCRISGRPGRAAAIEQFLAYVTTLSGVWIAGRDEIARWWLEQVPPPSSRRTM